MVHLMNLRMGFGLPTAFYYRTVHEGYKDCGLDTSVLERALRSSADKYHDSAARRSGQKPLFDRDSIGYEFDGSVSNDEDPDEDQDDDV